MAEDFKQDLLTRVPFIDNSHEIIDRSFEEFGQREENTLTVDQFFQIYEELFFEIPVEGEQSHRYLVEKSSQLLNLDKDVNLVDIQPLLDEINSLRERNLELQEQVSKNIAGTV